MDERAQFQWRILVYIYFQHRVSTFLGFVAGLEFLLNFTITKAMKYGHITTAYTNGCMNL